MLPARGALAGIALIGMLAALSPPPVLPPAPVPAGEAGLLAADVDRAVAELSDALDVDPADLTQLLARADVYAAARRASLRPGGVRL